MELNARMAMERTLGRPLSDPEWASTKRNLLEYARLLFRWQKNLNEASHEKQRDFKDDRQIQILRPAA
jgi:hypothetical protein